MPNICFNELKITGCSRVIEDLYKKLIVQMPKGYERLNLKAIADCDDERVFPDCCTTLYEKLGEMSISFDSAYSPPTDWITKVSLKYPGLTFELEYKEPSNDVFGKTEWFFDGGEQICTETGYTRHEWCFEHDPDYVKEYKRVTKGDYKEFLDKYSDPESLEDLFTDSFESLKPFILERIKDEDLPMFINHDWEDIEDDYFNRMTKGGHNVCEGKGTEPAHN